MFLIAVVWNSNAVLEIAAKADIPVFLVVDVALADKFGMVLCAFYLNRGVTCLTAGLIQVVTVGIVVLSKDIATVVDIGLIAINALIQVLARLDNRRAKVALEVLALKQELVRAHAHGDHGVPAMLDALAAHG